MTTKTKATDFFKKQRKGKPLTLAMVLWSIRMCDEMSQVDFAEKLGISRAHLCDIEKGRAFLSAERAARFADILNHSRVHFVQMALQEELDRHNLGILIGNIEEKKLPRKIRRFVPAYLRDTLLQVYYY
jgi:transcriptional regulator with XRE-family HTH domain